MKVQTYDIRVDAEKKELQYNLFSNNTLKIKTDEPTGENTLPYSEYMKLNSRLLSILDTEKETIIADDIYKDNTVDFSDIKTFDQKTGYRSQSIVIEPIFGPNNKLLGILQIMNKKNIYNETIGFDKYDRESIKTFALQVSLAIENT